MAARALALSLSWEQINNEKVNIPIHKKRRKRTIITQNVLDKLEKMFLNDQWPSREKKEKMAVEIGKSDNFVHNWFQNRRARMRKTAPTCRDILNDVDVTKTNLNQSEQKITFHEIKFNSRSCEMKTDKAADSITNILGIKRDEDFQSESLTQKTDYSGSDTNKDKVVMKSADTSLETPWEMIFRKIVEMTAASEGVLRRTHPTFTEAVTDAALGIKLRDGKLIYNKEYGLDVTYVE